MPNSQLQCERDKYLIQLAKYCQRLSQKYLLMIKICRIFLEATTLSGIYIGGKTRIQQEKIYIKEDNAQWIR